MLCDRLRELRATAGLSQGKASLLAGLSRWHISKIEAKPLRHIESTTLQKLCRLFGCSMDWLVSGTGEPPSKKVVLAAIANADAHFEAEKGAA